MSAAGELLLGKLPYYERQSWEIRAAVDAAALELERIKAARKVLQDNFFADTADAYLHWWEALLGLPPNPPGKTVAQRRTVVLAYLRAIRQSGSGLDWQTAIGNIVGPSWSYHEGPANYTVTVTIPYSAGSIGATDAERLAREVTPAHIDLIFGYGKGFIAGVSVVGQEPL